MRLANLAARDQAATNRIVAAAEKLAAAHGIDSDIVARVQTQRGDPAVRAMLQREAVADLLDELLELSTVQPPADPHPLEAVDGVSSDLAASLVEAGIETLDDLVRASDEYLLEVPGVGKATLAKIRKALDS